MFKNSKRFFFTIVAGIMVIGMATSCEEEFNNLDLAGVTPTFEAERAYYPVHARNRRLASVQTNGLNIYQLGKYNHPVFGQEESFIVSQVQLGAVNPTFGTYSQATEMADDDLDNTIDEHETVTKVYLDIPYFSSNARNDDGTPVLDDDGDATYTLDSIYGNQQVQFSLLVDELTYYLGDYDPDSNFTEGATYYSSSPDLNFENYLGENFYSNTQYQIDPNTIKIMQEDDESTEEIESDLVDEVLPPRIRIDLANNYFQTKILDMEGSDELNNNNNFKEYFRGVVLRTAGINDDLLMLLSLADASIVIEYQYRRYDPVAEEGYVLEDASFSLLLSGNIVQQTTTDGFPNIDETVDPDALYIKGGQGSMVELSLFEDNFGLDQEDIETPEAVSLMDADNWLINEANLTFSINHDLLDENGDLTEPVRLYLYNLDDPATPLIDYTYDGTSDENNPYYSRYIFGGIIERDDNGTSDRYKVRITEHLNGLMRNGNTNVRLGLVVTSNINTTTALSAITDSGDEELIPSASVTNPLGTVIYGTGANVPEDQRLRLEIFYTNPN